MSRKVPLKKDIKHFNKCPGCPLCDYILETYGQCYCCNILMSKEYLYYDHPTGDYYCPDCIGSMPKDNSSEFIICDNCYTRFKQDDIIYDYPTGGSYCPNCVELIPEKNTKEFAICQNCHKRELKEEMTYTHYNFQGILVCKKCVYDSVIHNRFEILDI